MPRRRRTASRAHAALLLGPLAGVLPRPTSFLLRLLLRRGRRSPYSVALRLIGSLGRSTLRCFLHGFCWLVLRHAGASLEWNVAIGENHEQNHADEEGDEADLVQPLGCIIP